MEWIEDQKWKKWFAWHKVLIKGVVGESYPKIVWLKMVERRIKVKQVLHHTYIDHEYREI